MRTVVLSAIICLATFDLTVAADADAAIRKPTAIAAQELGPALQEFAHERKLYLVYAAEDVGRLSTRGASGNLSAEETLIRLLTNTGLTYRFIDAQTVTIMPAGAPPALPVTGNAHGDADFSSDSDGLHVAQAEHADTTSDSSMQPPDTRPERAKPVQLEEVVVTGSNIRGAPPASPLIELTQQRMIEAGQTNLGDVIRSIPQNFSGGQNPGIGLGGGSINNQNVSGGSALNLRGLGPDATLTLLNGHRLSYDGFAQGVDISQIPLAAVDRIEIVADGASAIYGSDAVGGVANVILKPDYDGVSLSARLGRATAGGDFQQQYGVVGGTTWQGGGFILTLDSENDTDIEAQQRDYTRYLPYPNTLLPDNDAYTALFSGHQDLDGVATLQLDALYTHRHSSEFNNESTAIYGSRTKASDYTISPTVTFHLPATWNLSLNGVHGEDRSISEEPSYSTTDGSLTSDSKNCYCNGVDAWEVNSEGPFLRLPGGEVRAAVGGGYRRNSFDEHSLTSSTTVSGEEHSYFGFAELFVPLVSPDLGIPALDRLSLSAAVRHENYNDFGGVTTPKLGIVYAPTADLDLKSSWGKSFKTPTLLQQYETTYAELFPAAALGASGYPGTATAFLAYGGNRNLQPERATSWTTTLGLHPRAIPDFQADITYFHIDYAQRILLPFNNVVAAFSDPIYRQFLDLNPTAAQQQALLNTAGRNFFNETSVAYNPANVIGIANDLYVNVASQQIHGIDLSGSYRIRWGGNLLTLSEDASRLDSRQQNSALEPVFALAGTVFNPPHWRSRFGATWQQGPLTLAAFYNFIGGVTDTTTTPNIAGGSMQTVDLNGTLHLGGAIAALRDTDVSLSIQNLADQRPPYKTNAYPFVVNYDTTNYPVVGRFIGVTLTKRFH